MNVKLSNSYEVSYGKEGIFFLKKKKKFYIAVDWEGANQEKQTLLQSRDPQA